MVLTACIRTKSNQALRAAKFDLTAQLKAEEAFDALLENPLDHLVYLTSNLANDGFCTLVFSNAQERFVEIEVNRVCSAILSNLFDSKYLSSTTRHSYEQEVIFGKPIQDMNSSAAYQQWLEKRAKKLAARSSKKSCSGTTTSTLPITKKTKSKMPNCNSL